MTQSVLKNAGIASPEVELLKEIARLREVLAGTKDEKKQSEIRKQIQEKHIEFSLRLEKMKK